MKRECPKPFRWGVATLLAAALMLAATCASAQGIKDFLSKAFGSHMNDVAEKIEEWADPGSGAIDFNPVFSPDGSVLASFGNDTRKINIWDWRNRRLLRKLDNLGDPELSAEPLAFSPDGRFLALCTGGGERGYAVRVWSTATWEVARDIPDTASWGCHAVAFSADSRLLLRVNDETLSSDPDDLIAYSTETWQKLWGLRDKRIQATTLAVSPAGNLTAVGGGHYVVPPDRDPSKVKYEPKIALLDLQQRKYVRIIFPAPSNSMSWSPDGTKLAVAGVSNFDIYDMRSGEQLVRHSLPGASHTSIRYSPDGKYLVISGFNGYAGPGRGIDTQIWDGDGKKLLQKIKKQAAGIAISRDSRYLAVAKRGRIEIWQLK